MSNDPQGTKDAVKRYQLIPRTLNFLYHGDEVLLLKGAPHKRLWANLYNGIGGHIEQGESIFDSAMREIQEESGISDVMNLRLRGIITIDTNANPGILLFLFTATTNQRTIQESSEGKPAWVNWHNLPSEAMVEDLPILLGKLDSMPPSDSPFYAHYSYDETGKLFIQFADH